MKPCFLAAIALALGWLSVQAADHQEVIEKVREAAYREIREGNLTGVSVALVKEGEVIYAGGFGVADKRKKTAAEGDTVYRVASISKLFNALAIMRAQERGILNIDEPVNKYVEQFQPINPFPHAVPITLRHLLSHRSGMFRESPVGSYFDPNEPALAKMVESLNSCALVHPPGVKTKYSNSGVGLSGYALELASGKDYATYVYHEVLKPLGMTRSAFLPSGDLKKRLATGYMLVAQPDGSFKEIEAPVFQFGMLPAANIYTSARELAMLATYLAGGTNLLKPETLEQMATPQFTKETNGFGLGFNIGSTRGQKTVSHMGEVYGFTSSFYAIPSKKIGAVVLSNNDIAEGPVRRLMSRTLDALLGAEPEKEELKAVLVEDVSGEYESDALWARLEMRGTNVQGVISGQPIKFSPAGERELIGNGHLFFNQKAVFEKNGSNFTFYGQKFKKAGKDAAPPAYKDLVGSYGPRFIPLIVTVRNGNLYAMTENYLDYKLTPITGNVFKMPTGMYSDEYLVFERDGRGKVTRAVLANIPLPRH